MTRFARYGLAVVVLGLATAFLSTACGAPAVANEMEVTFYYLPG